MSSTFGAPLGGTTRAGQYGLESAAVSLITPPNGSGGGGICFPSIVTVVVGEPGVPVISGCALRPAQRPARQRLEMPRLPRRLQRYWYAFSSAAPVSPTGWQNVRRAYCRMDRSVSRRVRRSRISCREIHGKAPPRKHLHCGLAGLVSQKDKEIQWGLQQVLLRRTGRSVVGLACSHCPWATRIRRVSPTTVGAIHWLSSQSHVDGHEERDGARDRLDGDLPAVNRQYAGATLAEAGDRRRGRQAEEYRPSRIVSRPWHHPTCLMASLLPTIRPRRGGTVTTAPGTGRRCGPQSRFPCPPGRGRRTSCAGRSRPRRPCIPRAPGRPPSTAPHPARQAG